MIIHSHKKHISLQILHWMHNDVVVQCSFTRVCQGVPNKMLGASYTNRDVSSFQTRDLYCNGRNKYVQLSHLLFVLEMFRWYVVLDKFVSYSRRQSTSFFDNFKLELYSFCEPCPYIGRQNTDKHTDKLINTYIIQKYTQTDGHKTLRYKQT